MQERRWGAPRESLFFARTLPAVIYNETHLNPLAFLATLAAGIFLLTARRSQAILPVVLVACLIPGAQRLVVATLDFTMIRLLIVFGWVRLAMRNEIRPLRLNGLDWAFIAWTLAAGTGYVLREESFKALVYRLGFAFDALGMYFLFRMLLRRPSDTLRSARYLAWCAAIVAVCISIEWSTGRNLFSVFGGVPAVTWIRDGRLRCQGAFSHPIMAGTFGAMLVPIFMGMWFAFPRRRLEAAAGAASGMIITAASASSGPVLSLAAALVAWGVWPLRHHTRALRRTLLIVTLALHFGRKKPIWHLAARASDFMGGEGYHRYLLIDAFINHWREWFLVGTASTAHWGFMLWDTTNQFVQEGVTGGIADLVAFLCVVVFAYRSIGLAGKAGRQMEPARSPRAQRLWCWGLGAAVTAHTAAFMGVSYWGQIQFILYLFLALVGAEYALFEVAARARSPHVALRPARARPLAQEPVSSAER